MPNLTPAIKDALCIACADRVSDLANHLSQYREDMTADRVVFWQGKIDAAQQALAWITDLIPSEVAA